ncbi:MAG: pilus (MSHA type) biogenesis protein MshL, partial [Sulfurospirillum sp.]
MKKSLLNSIRNGLVTGALLTGISTSAVYAKSCNYRAFNIKVSDEVATSEILNQLSNECSFSIVTKDSLAKEKLSQKLYGINIKHMRLNEIFDVLISAKGLDYDFDNRLLTISGLKTKTFKIDYVNTERSGV